MNNIGNNLKRIRLLKNLSLEKAGKLLDMSAPGLSKYEKGSIMPNSKKLIEFANAYEVKTIDLLEYFEAPNMKFTSFRKRKRLTGEKLNLLKEIIQNEVSKYLEIIDLNNINSSNKLKSYNCNSLKDADAASTLFRKELGISNIQPISDLINILENLGIIIIQIPNYNNKFDDFDGLSEIVKDVPIIVLLNDIKDGARQRFTIAHELGHLVLKISNKNLDEEKLCNRFAASLLMPKESIINEFDSSRNNISFFELKAFKNEYKVSYAAIVYRLNELNIISEYTYRNLNMFLSKNINKNDPEPINPETSLQFRKIVHKLEIDNIISFNRACELLGVSNYEYNRENNNY